MEFKGTKGKLIQSKKYFRDTKGNNAKWICIKDEQGRTIAEVKGAHYDIADEECKANALLISKAPEMLEMLMELSDKLSKNEEIPLDTTIKYWFEYTVEEIKELIKEATEL